MSIRNPSYQTYRRGEDGLCDLNQPYTVPAEETYVGCVIELRERNGYHDSDFDALVWDEDEQRVRSVEYASTRYGGGGVANVDLTAENRAKVEQYWQQAGLTSVRAHVACNVDTELQNPKVRGDFVRVVGGRPKNAKTGEKVAVGTVGVVFWVGEPRKFGYYSASVTKVGVALDDSRNEDGTYANVCFTSAANLHNCNWESVTDEQQAELVAQRVAQYSPLQLQNTGRAESLGYFQEAYRVIL